MTGTAITGLSFAVAAIVWAAAWTYSKWLRYQTNTQKIRANTAAVDASRQSAEDRARISGIVAELGHLDDMASLAQTTSEDLRKLEAQVRDITNTLQMRKLK